MIAFDVSHANDPRRTGIGRVVEEHLRSIAWLMDRGEWALGDLTLLSSRPYRFDDVLLKQLRAHRVETLVLPCRSMYVYRATLLPVWVMRNKPELLFVPEPIHPLQFGDSRLAVMHYDLIARKAPEAASRHIRLLYRMFLLSTLKRAHYVGVDSQFVRGETEELLPGFAQKSEVLPIYVHQQQERAATPPEGVDPRQPFALFIGNLLPHKNVRRLVAAFEEWKSVATADFCPLYIVGRPRPEVDDTTSLIRSLSEKGIVKHFGYINDEQIEWLYRNARFFAFPSLIEGFGLPILEAMSRGCPVLTAAGGATGETAGGAALLVDARDTRSILEGLRGIGEDENLRAELRRLGTARAESFTRERHTAALQGFLERCLA